MNKIRIEGLTPVEVWYLDILWSIQTQEELDAWKEILHQSELELVNRLQQLLLMEVLDQDLEKKDKFPRVESYLKKFMLQNGK